MNKRNLSVSVALAVSLAAALGMTGCGVSPAYKNAIAQGDASLALIQADYTGYVNADSALSDVDRQSRLMHLESTRSLFQAILEPAPTPE
jgi:hypothetical protein